MICPECGRGLSIMGGLCGACRRAIAEFRAMARGWWRRG